MIYTIMGKYQNEATEEIDEFANREDAKKMLSEYYMAFGGGWRLWIKRKAKS